MLAALAVVAAVTVLARGAVASPLLGRMRVLFPAWRFFDRATSGPALLVRFAPAGGELGAWSAIQRRRRGRPLRWLVAPFDNLALAYQSVVDQLVHELGELDADGPDDDPAIVGLVSYELVTRIARGHVPARARFQWKLVVPAEPAPEDYLVSLVFAA